MGGMGSGQKRYLGAKDTTDDYRSIDVRRWKREGLLSTDQVFGWQWSRRDEVIASIHVVTQPDRVILIYRHRTGSNDWEEERYPVYLDWSPCNLGGKRPWFRCPVKACGRRVAILYGGNIFTCRHCRKLSYQSQRESNPDRNLRRAEKIRDKLDWVSGVLNSTGCKPKGMHWSTFKRLKLKHDALVQIACRNIASALNVDISFFERHRDY